MVLNSFFPTSIFDDLYEDFSNDFVKSSNTIKKSLCSSNFPPSDISIDENNNFIIELALAGYNEADLDIDYEEGSLTISSKKSIKNQNRTYFKTGIKRPDSFEVSFAIDISRYNVELLKAKMVQGILTITIPLKADFVTKKSFKISPETTESVTETA